MAGSLFDAERLIAAVQELGGHVPVALTNILVTRDMLEAQSVSSSDPATAIVKAGVAGNLSEKRLATMLAEAAQAQMIGSYIGDLRSARLEPLLARKFHNALKAGAANDLLASLRPVFTEAAEAIARTRAVIAWDSELEHIVNSAQPGDDTVALWQQLPAHLTVVAKVGAIAAAFGVRPSAQFSLIGPEYPGSNPTDDRALFCANGPSLEADSLPFVQWGPNQEGRRSPWYRIPLALNSVEQAVERYRQWCENQWEFQHPNKVVKFIRPEDGNPGETTLVNPYLAKASV